MELQQHLMRMEPAELRAAIAELAPHLPALSVHTFGNYLVSSLANFPEAHSALFTAVRGRVQTLMQHPQGSRAIQAVMAALPVDLVQLLVLELEGCVADVARNTHGSWSIDVAYKNSHAPFIIHEVAAQVSKLSVLQNGSRVAQRVMAEATAVGADIRPIVRALLLVPTSTLASIAADRFGNYVVQLALRGANAVDRKQLIDILLPLAFTPVLSQSKCGSNVAELIVELATDHQLALMRNRLNNQKVTAMRSHQYSRFVMIALERRL